MNPIISIPYIVLIAIVILIFTGVISWRTSHQVSIIWRLFMVCSRLLAVAGVLALLLNFGYKQERFTDLNESWVIMLDHSSSMSYEDVNGNSRWDAAKEIIAQAFQIASNKEMIHLYGFSDTAGWLPQQDIDSIDPDGSDTRIIESGQQVLLSEKSSNSLLRGILLLSDGREPREQSADDFSLKAAANRVPVYPIVLGHNVPFKDLEINIPQLRHVSFVGQPMTINGTIKNERLGPIQAEVILSDGQQKTIDNKKIFLQNSQKTAFSFDLTLDKPGYYEYVIHTPQRSGEADRANNTVGLGVFVLEDRLNVLLLEGEPYWDTKFLSHMLRAQTNIEMTAVFRVTKDRFFKVSTDTEMTTSDTDTFPETIEELSKFDLIVLGKGTEYFIDAKRAKLLEDFVKNQGGCLFFARGKSYSGSDSWLKGLEPVKWGKAVTADFSLKPLLSGEQVGLFGGLLPASKDHMWQNLPALTRAYQCPQLNSFASVLADGIPDNGNEDSFPLLVSKRYGRGLVLLINGDGLWQWGFSQDVVEKKDVYQDVYQNLWLRLFQWSVSFAEFNPGSDYFIRTDRSTLHIDEPLRINVQGRPHVKTEKREKPVVRMYQNTMLIQTIVLAGDSTRDLGWSGLVTINKPGIYRLVTETDAGKDLSAQTTIQVLSPPQEADNLSANPAFLEDIAIRSGGRIITRDDLKEIITDFETVEESRRKGDIKWQSLWDKYYFLVLLFIMFALEWYVRRRQGLR